MDEMLPTHTNKTPQKFQQRYFYHIHIALSRNFVFKSFRVLRFELCYWAIVLRSFTTIYLEISTTYLNYLFYNLNSIVRCYLIALKKACNFKYFLNIFTAILATVLQIFVSKWTWDLFKSSLTDWQYVWIYIFSKRD